MKEQQSFISAVMAELSRRKVLRTMGAYAVGVFVMLQLMDAAVEPLRLPDWIPTLVIIGLILGFPLVFGLAWQFDITGEGIRRTDPDGLLTPGQRTAVFSVMVLATGSLGMLFYQYYAAVFEESSAITAPAVALRDFSAPENSIAVLPFADLSETGDQVHFSDGIAEEILNLLAQVDGLHVAARTSSFAFRNPQQDIRDIGRALNVRTVLEGSLRTAGNRIRMTAQLINVEDGYHIWSQTFDRELTDLFVLQDEVANSIARALVDSFDSLATRPSARTQSLAAFLNQRLGADERASEQLAQAEQGVRRARINGIETADLYYTQSVIQSIKGETAQALTSLRSAYDLGFRQAWVLDLDVRLDPLRGAAEFNNIRHDIEVDMKRALNQVRSRQVVML